MVIIVLTIIVLNLDFCHVRIHSNAVHSVHGLSISHDALKKSSEGFRLLQNGVISYDDSNTLPCVTGRECVARGRSGIVGANW